MAADYNSSKSVLLRSLVMLLLAAVVLTYQACTQMAYTVKNPAPSIGHSVTGGEGFDGKIFVHYGACPGERLDIVAKLAVAKDQQSATVVRENCQDLAVPHTLPIANFKFAMQDDSVLTWKDQIFDQVISQSAQRVTVALCNSVGVTPNTQVAIWQSANSTSELFGRVTTLEGSSTGELRVTAPPSQNYPFNYTSVTGQASALDLAMISAAGGSLQYAINSMVPVMVPTMSCLAQSAPIMIVQELAAAANQVSANQFVLNLPTTSAGNLLAVGITYPPNMGCTTDVRDNAPGGGNVFTSAGAFAYDSSTGASEIWYVANSKSGGTQLTINNCGLGPTIFYVEVSGLADANPIDGAPAVLNEQPSRTNFVAPAVTTTSQRAFVFSVMSEGAVLSLTPTGNYFTRMPVVSWDAAAYYISSVTGSYGAVWDQDPTGPYCASTVAFKARW